MSNVSKLASTILGYHIGEAKWKESLDIIDKSGEPTLKNMGRLIFMLCSELEAMQGELNELKGTHGSNKS